MIPKKIAFAATQANLKKVELQEKKRQEQSNQEKQAALDIATKLNKASCTLSVEVNDLDKLYGAVKEADVAKALEDEGFTVDKKDITFEKPIEELGIFEIGVNLHPEVTAKIRLWVTKK